MSAKGKSASKVISKSSKTAPSPKLEKPEVETEEQHEESHDEDHTEPAVESENEADQKENPDNENEAEADHEAEGDVENEAEGDQEAEGDAEAEEAEPKKKTTKKATKVTGKKSKSESKSSSKGKGKSKNSDAEDEAHKARMTAAAESNLVTYFPEMAKRNSNDKWGVALTTHILEGISHLQQEEIRKEGDYNPFPASGFYLYEDQIKSKEDKKSKGKSVKTKSGSVPSKPNVPIKRGQKAAPVPEPEEEEEEEEEEVEVDEADQEADSGDSGDKKDESKTPPRRRIVKLSKQAKTYLGFVLTRFVDEFFCADDFKSAKSSDDFTKQVFTKISKDTQSQMSRVVVCTVNEHRQLIANYSEGIVKAELDARLAGYFKNRVTVFNFICSYAADYIKLLAHHLATQLWLANRGISAAMLETAMRSLALGNHRYMIDNKLIGEDEDDCGITRGVMQDARLFDKIVNPPPVLSEEEKEEKAKKEEEKKLKKAKDAAARKAKKEAEKKNAEKSTKSKGSKKATAKKGKKVVDEPEEDAEDAEANPEEDAENAEANPEEDAEDAEANPEEDAEEEPKSKKNVKSLTKPKSTKKTSKK